jgi:hypothetical protein
MKVPPSPPDDFETLLAAQPFRPPPPEWRDPILAAARHAAGTAPARRPHLRPLPRLRHAWAALAAVWVGLALLHFDTPPAPVYAGQEPRPTLRDFERHLAHHQAEIARLLDLVTPAPVAAAADRRQLPLPPHGLSPSPFTPPVP